MRRRSTRKPRRHTLKVGGRFPKKARLPVLSHSFKEETTRQKLLR
jgi:hypothetical protein